jgi:hypothetical protein
MIVICAWCTKQLRDVFPYDDRQVSHGCCETCERELMKGLHHESTAGDRQPPLRRIK